MYYQIILIQHEIFIEELAHPMESITDKTKGFTVK